MHKTFPRGNLGLEFPVILSSKLINYYWMPAESKMMYYEKLFLFIIALKVTSSGEYSKACNIIVWLENCRYNQICFPKFSNGFIFQTTHQLAVKARPYKIPQYSTKWGSSEFFLCIMKFKTAELLLHKCIQVVSHQKSQYISIFL